jgi:hypothetical protein
VGEPESRSEKQTKEERGNPMNKRRTLIGMVVAILAGLALWAVDPPLLVNYQGVLRNTSNAPLTGIYDMTFSFFDQAAGGTLLLTDAHTAAGGLPVTVSGGLFSAALGAGILTPGSETTTEGVFKNHTAVYLSVQVGSEFLTPRVQVVSAAYSQNSHALDGKEATDFALASHVQTPAAGGTGIDTSATAAGSLLYTSAVGTWNTLARVTNGQVLQLSGGLPQWGAPPSDEIGRAHV